MKTKYKTWVYTVTDTSQQIPEDSATIMKIARRIWLNLLNMGIVIIFILAGTLISFVERKLN